VSCEFHCWMSFSPDAAMLLGGGMVILICTRNTQPNIYKAGGGREECIGTRLSLRLAPMTGGRMAQARIFPTS
jgi:hypothetical protein